MIGSIYMYAGSTIPAGFLLCDGTSVSRSTYADLFAVIGTAFGVGDGSTTFNLPNLSGKVAIGKSSNYALGATGGSETCVLADTNLPAHVHEVPTHGHANDITAVTPSLSHTITQPSFTYAGPGGTYADGSYTNLSAYGQGSSSVAATSSTNVAVANHAATACTGGITIADSSTFDTESAGGSVGHNNMQPYVVMPYIIQVAE